ncbi:MAG: hypothetical protein P8Y38_00670 [Deltaproteobacteria bacterium]
MARRRRKTVSFDAMVKFFIRNYDIPTRKDIEILNNRLDRIEKLILAQPSPAKAAGAAGRSSDKAKPKGRSGVAASEKVLAIMQNAGSGMTLADIKAHTGYNDKKLRNIIFRLHSMQRIRRVSRGVYTAV